MSVPSEYLGVWKRTLLRTPDIEDTTTEVYWMQTPTFHADIRVPAKRPRELNSLALSAMSREQLLALTDQQGFAGVTMVEDDICRWHRKYDYQPPSGFSDVGRMEFESEHRALEYGIEQDYFEIWDRLPESVGTTVALDITSPGSSTPSWLLRTGSCVMRMRPRRALLELAPSLRKAAARVDETTLREWLDFEISFGRMIDADRWRVERSTLPQLEGTTMSFRETAGAPLIT